MCKFKNGFGSIRVADSRSIILSVWTDNRTQSVSKLTLNVGGNSKKTQNHEQTGNETTKKRRCY